MRSNAGFSLIEVLVATCLVAGGISALAQLLVIAGHVNGRARFITTAAFLAQHKVEQLRGLSFGFDSNGLPWTDTTTDTRVAPEAPAGGTGLSSSPADALSTNVDGYCDFADAAGRLLGLGSGTPASSGAAYIRRWSITPLPANPARSVVIQVVVLGVAPGFSGELTRLIDIRTRRPF
jgi:Tfp pilus assembly protein PilV